MDFSTIKTTARVREWQYLSGPDFEKMDREKTVVMLACSPLEVHGPHLPVGADNIEADYLSLRAMEMINGKRPEMEFVHLPPLYTAADVTPYAGSMMFRPSTIIAAVSDIGRTLGKQGFKHIWISSFHGGPRHFVPMEIAADRCNRRYGTRMISAFSLLVSRLTKGGSDLTKILSEIPGLKADDLEGDTHGGLIETSMLLHICGKYVKPGFKDLPRRTVDIMLQEQGKPPLRQDSAMDLIRSFKPKLNYFETETYAGKPQLGSAETGERIIDILARHTADALLDVYDGKIPLEECHSPLWPVRWIFASRTAGWLFERFVNYQNRIF
jgi:creatinine amidohydrolase/Fe(II)-dependent formamide hydrolase-like protein